MRARVLQNARRVCSTSCFHCSGGHLIIVFGFSVRRNADGPQSLRFVCFFFFGFIKQTIIITRASVITIL